MATPVVGAQTEDVRERLRRHYEDALRNYGKLFEPKTARPPGAWPASIEYRMTGGVAYYYNEAQTVVLSLEFPEDLEGVRDEIKGHLGPENWAKWEKLARETNAHLEAVTAMWRQILAEFGAVAHEIGLFPYEKLFERPLDIYWPSKFLEAIWLDVGYYDKNRMHLWDTAKIVEQTTAIPMRHTLDVVQTFVFSDLPWILTQSKDAAEAMKKAWEDEAVKVEPKVWELLEERTLIENEARELLSILRHFEIEYEGYHRPLPNACLTCKPWLDELARSAQSA